MSLRVDNISVTLKQKKIVKGLSFTLTKADRLGILGPNGCGKSTFLKAIVGTLPYSGSINLHNSINDTSPNDTLSFGFVPEEPILYSNLTILQNLLITTSFINDSIIEIYPLLKKLHIENLKHRKAGSLSLGEKKRLAIALALIKNPDVLIFDEPHNGLDLDSIKIFNRIIEIELKNRIVIVSSHSVGQIEKFFNKVLIMFEGNAIEYSNIADLVNKFGSLENAYHNTINEKFNKI